jgi:hypothetical protein
LHNLLLLELLFVKPFNKHLNLHAQIPQSSFEQDNLVGYKWLHNPLIESDFDVFVVRPFVQERVKYETSTFDVSRWAAFAGRLSSGDEPRAAVFTAFQRLFDTSKLNDLFQKAVGFFNNSDIKAARGHLLLVLLG